VSRASSKIHAARDRITATRERIEAKRPRSKLLDSMFGVAEHDVVTGGGVLAGAVAFRLFMFLVPYVFVLVAFLGFAAGQSDRPVALAGGLIALFLAAKALIKTLQTVHGFIWGASPPKRAGPAFAAIGLTVVVTAGLVVARGIAGLRGEVAGVLFVALYIAVPTGVWWLVSARAIPHAEGATWRDLLPGPIAFGVGFEVLHVITIVWISHLIENKTDTYGVLGTALALLFWSYVMGRVIALSAVVNASRWFRTHPPRGTGRGGVAV
jgi:hypothetical protein